MRYTYKLHTKYIKNQTAEVPMIDPTTLNGKWFALFSRVLLFTSTESFGK